MKFSELKLNANVLDALDAMRFDECTPIQEQAIPIILEGKDLMYQYQQISSNTDFLSGCQPDDTGCMCRSR